MMVAVKSLVLPLKPVIKRHRRKKERYTYSKEKMQKSLCDWKRKILHHKLPMKLVETEYTLTEVNYYFILLQREELISRFSKRLSKYL